MAASYCFVPSQEDLGTGKLRSYIRVCPSDGYAAQFAHENGYNAAFRLKSQETMTIIYSRNMTTNPHAACNLETTQQTTAMVKYNDEYDEEY